MFTSDDEITGRFTFEAEGHIDPDDPYFIGKLTHPKPESGVTIGAGYDMKERSESQVKTDLIKAGLVESISGELAKGANKTGVDADAFVAVNKKKLIIEDVNVLQNLFGLIYPDYVNRARNHFRYWAGSFGQKMRSYRNSKHQHYENPIFFDWEYLYPPIRVIAIDFAYQGFGGLPTQKHPFPGKPMHMCMANNFDWLIDYIISTPGLNEYEKGRRRAPYLRSTRRDFEFHAYCESPAVPNPLPVPKGWIEDPVGASNIKIQDPTRLD